MNHLTSLLTILLLCSLLLAACAPAAPAVTPTSSITDTPAPTATPFVQDKIDVGGYSLYLYCTGSGSPTVILEAGLGCDSRIWDAVALELEEFARVCVYDRAGLGKSDPAPTPRTTRDMAEDLHTLLTNANLQGHYILVGWSIGGFITRLYADQYPQEVAGMVLVDSSHPDQDARISEVLPPPSENDSQEMKDFREIIQTDTDPSTWPEGLDFPASCAQVRETSTLGDIPLVVISAGLNEYPPDFSKELVSQLVIIKTDLQKELVTLSTNSSQVIAKRSYHCIMCTQPEVIVDAIQEVFDQVRNK